MNRIFRSAAFYVVVALVLLVVASNLLKSGAKTERLSLSDFESRLAAGQVRSAEILDKDNELKGELKNDKKYKVSYPAQYSDELTKELQDHKDVETKVDPQKQNVWVSALFSFLPFVLLIVVFLWVMNSMQGGGNRVMQ